MNSIKTDLHVILKGADILIIVPPFTSNTPVLGPHLLQAVAREKGFTTEILYLNLLLASQIGYKLAENISTSERFQYWVMLNERLFARSAYNLPALGQYPAWCSNEAMSISGNEQSHIRMDYDESEPIDLNECLKLESICFNLVQETIAAISSLNYPIIGCTTRMGQTNCSIALLTGIKKNNPQTITIIGGANCQGDMAEGIASLSNSIDYIFSGESELTFSHFLDLYTMNQLPTPGIITGEIVQNLDSLPPLDYQSYFQQLHLFFKSNESTIAGGTSYIWSETSRGCWWGEKNKCTFCSRNNESLLFRAKSPQKVLSELSTIKKNYPDKAIAMADNILPHSYYADLFPVMAKDSLPEICLYYTKANITLKNLLHLKQAGVKKIVPGIESLSSGLLKLLNKGVQGAQNLLLLRNAASVGLNMLWFMLWGAPEDQLQFYQETLAILPLIHHLQPPQKFFHVNLERFSHYVEHPEQYQIKNIRPWRVYHTIFPETANIEKLAFGFTGDYPSAAHQHPEVIQLIAKELEQWHHEWPKAKLFMIPFVNYYVVRDHRMPGHNPESYVLETSRAKEIMQYGNYTDSEHQNWALTHKLGVILDDKYVPLITATPELLMELNS